MFVRPWVNRGLGACSCSPMPAPGLAGRQVRLVKIPPAVSGLGGPRAGLPRVGGVRGLGSGIPISVESIREGRLGTADTIRRMGELALAAAHDPSFVAWVRGQVADLKSKDYLGEAERIFEIVHKHVRYSRDPHGLEILQDPRAVLWQDGTGDCDEHATTIAAMAIALGHHCAFRTVAANYEPDPKNPKKSRRSNEWSHVYAMIGVDDPYAPEGVAWWAADTTQSNAALGWEPPAHRVWNKKDWIVI